MNPSASPTRMSLALRVGYAIAALVTAAALALHATTWMRTGAIQWGPALSMLGLLVLMATGALALPYGKSRTVLTIIGIAGVAVGAGVVFLA